MLHTPHPLINEQVKFLYKNSTTGRGRGGEEKWERGREIS
jgi:hypothetical protein